MSIPEPPPALPDLLRFNDGSPVRTPNDWARRRSEVAEAIIPLQYGHMPPAVGVRAELLNSSVVKRFLGARFVQYRLTVEGARGSMSFILELTIPPGEGPMPVLLNGDGCWRYLTDEVVMESLRRHTMIAQFNRCELAADAKSMDRGSGIYPLFPDHDFGAIAAWAWGYHRCVDFLVTLKEVDAAKIAIAGHSRGGKCVLLAGATDPRIALTAPNNSGCGGAGSYHFQAPGSETLTDILGPFAYWFGPSLPAYARRQNELPFDQHFLKALVAPRVLLTTEALGDLWANPVGTFHTHAAAKPVYALLGAADNIGVVYREGVHQHGLADWVTVLECMDWHFRGVRGERSFAGEAVNRGPVMEVGVKL